MVCKTGDHRWSDQHKFLFCFGGGYADGGLSSPLSCHRTAKSDRRRRILYRHRNGQCCLLMGLETTDDDSSLILATIRPSARKRHREEALVQALTRSTSLSMIVQSSLLVGIVSSCRCLLQTHQTKLYSLTTSPLSFSSANAVICKDFEITTQGR